MNYLKLFFTGILFLAVAACSPVYKTEYRYSAPTTAEGRSCANNCLDALQSCRNECRAEEKDCRYIKNIEASAQYLVYVTEQKAAGKEIEKEKRDFENYSACKTDCEPQCEQSQRICHVNCGGQITETRYCTAFCD